MAAQSSVRCSVHSAVPSVVRFSHCPFSFTPFFFQARRSDRSQKDRFSSDPSDDSASPDHRIHASEEKEVRVLVFPTEHSLTSG